MDSTPFFEFSITEIKENEIVELKKFHKSYFDIESITNTASELKYLNELRNFLNKELHAPSDNFVSFFTRQIYSGTLTAKVKEQFTPIIKRTFNLLISDAINERLRSALKQEKEPEAEETLVSELAPLIVTTEEELEGFYIIKSMLRQHIDAKRITYRDAQSYFAILLDDNNRKTICRLYLGNGKQSIAILDDHKKELKTEIKALEELYQYTEALLEVIARLEKGKST